MIRNYLPALHFQSMSRKIEILYRENVVLVANYQLMSFVMLTFTYPIQSKKYIKPSGTMYIKSRNESLDCNTMGVSILVFCVHIVHLCTYSIVFSCSTDLLTLILANGS